MIRNLGASLLLVAVALGCADDSEDAAPNGRPNVLLLIADDLGRGDVGFLGSSLATPSIDRIANEGVVLERFYAAPICSLTRAALLTGRSPARLGLLSVIRPWETRGLPPGEVTLAERLRDEGYATALVGKWHLGHARRSHWPRNHGFDHFYGSLGGAVDYFTHERLGGIDWQRNGETVEEAGYSTDLVAAEAQRWLRSVETAQPFFLAVTFHAPHPPRQAPRARLEKRAALPPKERVYAAMVDALDDAVGALLAELDRSGRTKNTLVVFLSDNGAGDAAHSGGLRGDKGSTLDGGMRAPAAIRWPAELAPGARSGQLLRSEDLYATILDALELGTDRVGEFANGDGREGESIWPELRAGTERERGPFFFAADSKDARSRALLEGRMKLVEVFDAGADAWQSQLFDIAADPAERSDLAGTHGEVRDRLAAQLQRWYEVELGSPARLPHVAPEGWTAPADWAGAAQP